MLHPTNPGPAEATFGWKDALEHNKADEEGA